jgi:hypothetical protein
MTLEATTAEVDFESFGFLKKPLSRDPQIDQKTYEGRVDEIPIGDLHKMQSGASAVIDLAINDKVYPVTISKEQDRRYAEKYSFEGIVQDENGEEDYFLFEAMTFATSDQLSSPTYSSLRPILSQDTKVSQFTIKVKGVDSPRHPAFRGRELLKFGLKILNPDVVITQWMSSEDNHTQYMRSVNKGVPKGAAASATWTGMVLAKNKYVRCIEPIHVGNTYEGAPKDTRTVVCAFKKSEND